MTIAENKSTHVTIGDKEYLYFGGTNYLGLAHRDELFTAAAEAFAQYGFSSGASRLTSGENELLLLLEKDLAAFAKAEDSVALPAGFMSNQAVVDAINDEVDLWIVQTDAHASIKAALRQSDKRVIVDEASVSAGRSIRDRLQLPSDCTLGIFAEPISVANGRVFDVGALIDQSQSRDFIVLDEAHSLGVLGESGIGALEYFDLPPMARLIRTGTFSKAVGTFGGLVIASEKIINSIKEKSPCYKGSTSLSPLACAAGREALRLIKQQPESTVAKLKRNVELMNGQLTALKMGEFSKNCTPIYRILETTNAGPIREALLQSDIFVPSVKGYFSGGADVGLRFTIQAAHDAAQLTMFTDCIAKVLQTTR